MPEIDQNFVNWLLSIVCGLLGWFGREMWSAVQSLKNELSALTNQLSKEYVAKTEFRDALRELKDDVGKDFEKFGLMLDKIYNRLDTIYDRLESKADKRP